MSPEYKKLHKALRDVIAACDNGSFASEDSSAEFLAFAPIEVRAVVKSYRRQVATLTRERDAALA